MLQFGDAEVDFRTTIRPVIDLDVDDSTDIAGDYRTSVEFGAGMVTIADTDLSVTDADDTSLVSMTLTFGGNVDAGNEIFTLGGVDFDLSTSAGPTTVNVGGSTYDVTYNAGTGVMSIVDSVGPDMLLAEVEMILAGGMYRHTGVTGTQGTRTIAVTANDGLLESIAVTSRIGVGTDTDGDGILDLTDIDDDNDGIVDTEERYSASLTTPVFGVPENGGTSTQTVNLSAVLPELSLGDIVQISEITANGDLNGGITETFTLNFNSGEFTTPNLATGAQSDGTQHPATPFVSQSVSVIDIGGGNLGLTILATSGTGVDDLNGMTDGLEYQFQIDISLVIDTDGDGVIDELDLDSDNDGISDLYESGDAAGQIADTNNDGTLSTNESADTDGDGLIDLFEDGDLLSNTGTTPIDTDSDGQDDYIDLDSDNDTIGDTIEARPSLSFAVNDGDVTNDDSDGDGIIDLFDTNPSFGGTHANFNNPVNTDGDALDDYRDTDSDNDGLLDSAEAGTITTAPSFADPDGSIASGTSNPFSTLDNSDLDPSDVDYRSLDNAPPTANNDSAAFDGTALCLQL